VTSADLSGARRVTGRVTASVPQPSAALRRGSTPPPLRVTVAAAVTSYRRCARANRNLMIIRPQLPELRRARASRVRAVRRRNARCSERFLIGAVDAVSGAFPSLLLD